MQPHSLSNLKVSGLCSSGTTKNRGVWKINKSWLHFKTLICLLEFNPCKKIVTSFWKSVVIKTLLFNSSLTLLENHWSRLCDCWALLRFPQYWMKGLRWLSITSLREVAGLNPSNCFSQAVVYGKFIIFCCSQLSLTDYKHEFII